METLEPIRESSCEPDESAVLVTSGSAADTHDDDDDDDDDDEDDDDCDEDWCDCKNKSHNKTGARAKETVPCSGVTALLESKTGEKRCYDDVGDIKDEESPEKESEVQERQADEEQEEEEEEEEKQEDGDVRKRVLESGADAERFQKEEEDADDKEDEKEDEDVPKVDLKVSRSRRERQESTGAERCHVKVLCDVAAAGDEKLVPKCTEPERIPLTKKEAVDDETKPASVPEEPIGTKVDDKSAGNGEGVKSSKNDDDASGFRVGNRNVNESDVNSGKNSEDLVAKIKSGATKSRDGAPCKDSVQLGTLKDKENIPEGGSVDCKPGARKLLSFMRKDDVPVERTHKETCTKPKCILTPLPAVASEFQPQAPPPSQASDVLPQPGVGVHATHRALPRQRHAPLTMAPPPTPPMSSQIPRLHRHCVMSYDGSGPGAGSSSGQQNQSSGTSSSSATRMSASSTRMSPPTQGVRRESVDDEEGVGSLGQQQYVVNVHVNPGETFSVCVSDQVQLIQGPATVRMVSNNGPPLPMPMQVPPGHMVQQIIDENGILTNVILSSQPPGVAAPPMMVGFYGSPSGTPPHHIYSPPYGPPYPPYPSQYAMHHHPHPGPHMHHMVPPRMHGASPPHHCNSHGHPPHLPTGHPPQPFHSSMTADDRPCSKGRPQNRNYKSKIHRDRYYINHSIQSPHSRTAPRLNGVMVREPHSESSSSDDPEMEEERRMIQEILSKMPPPKVLEIEPRSALIILTPPEVNQKDSPLLESAEFQYELHLAEKKDGKDGNYSPVYSGDATEITLQDLKPATEYHLKVHSILEDIKSNQTESMSFRTLCCQPDVPQPPKLVSKTTTSISLKWSAVPDNGSKITRFILESDQGQSDLNSFMTFVEIYSDLPRQFKVTKLNPSTGYAFRLAAVNAEGKSDYSDVVCFYTSGTAPTQPDPPMLSEQFVSALTVSWIRRPTDDRFTLQMEDEAAGRGFVLIYSGYELSYSIHQLHRNTDYRFRLQASNDEGASPWSDIVKYRTLPDKPQPPPRAQVKGKVNPHSFRVVWDPPKDSGGVDIALYLLQLDSGNGFESVYSGLTRDFTADQLVPGHTYWLRVACVSSHGQSEWSDVLSVITQVVPPGQCTSLRLHGKPQATAIHIKWAMPEFTGGAPFSDYEVLMTNPDSSGSEVYRGPEMECTVTGLLPGRSYLFQVRCLNRAGAGPWSETLEVVSGASVPDPPPQPVIICKSPHTAHISWGEPNNNGAAVTEYRLEWQQRDTEFCQLFCGLSVTAEVNGLLPATMYSFRVQAVNSAGAGPFSAIASCVTPPSNPGPVTSVRASSTATSIHVTWKEPSDNGSKIVSYSVGVDDRTLITVGNVLEYAIEDLLPETSYRVRVQAVNAIGLGAFSYPVKVMTRSLPPRPPVIECVTAGYNSLKLKWRDAKYQPDLFQYCLEMLRQDGSFHPVYQGSGHSHKISKLNELMQYDFRIYASNAAGDGPYSEVFRFRTSKAPPAIIKALRVTSLAMDSCVADWPALKPMGSDELIYILQIQAVTSRDQSFREIYRGPETSFRISGLASGSEYRLRMCAIRQTKDGLGDLIGPFSHPLAFTTESQKPAVLSSVLGSLPTKSSTERRKWSDQQWAVLLLLCFTLFAIFLAFLAQQIISHTTGGGGGSTTVEKNTTLDMLQ